MDGVLLIDKLVGITSFDVVRRVRKALNVRRVGHAGTLDPLASGLLVVCVGQATKLVPYLMDGNKQYRVTVTLGTGTDTLDSEGAVVETAAIPPFDEARLQSVLAAFIGDIDQVPPMFSALKRNGEALYKKARRGESVNLKPRVVRIDAIDIVETTPDTFTLNVTCGKGTYIRALARDIARDLGTVGHVSMLRRTSASGFAVTDATPLDTLEENAVDRLIPLAGALPHLPRLILLEKQETAIRYGQAIQVDVMESDGPVALVSGENALVAVAQATADGLVKPVRVFPK